MIKKLFLLATLAALTLFGFSAAAQNPVYLSSLKPVDSDAFQKADEMPYDSESKTSGVLMLGGVSYKTGFALFSVTVTNTAEDTIITER